MLSDAFAALWQVIAVGLLLGAGLPVLFAIGLRALYGKPPTPVSSPSTGGAPAVDAHPPGLIGAGPAAAGTLTEAPTVAPTPLGRVVAITCFAVCVLAVGFGIVVIVFGKQLFG